MIDYDFLTLSPFEFESLTRDLLQANWKVRLEAFGAGADQGIDLRYAKGEQIIVQCKRYKDFDSLWQTLKKELDNVIALAPKRYVLATSVSMLPERKEKLMELFEPYILSSDDIIGKEDLNNMLQQEKEVELNYYKLWLSSTNILQTIVNRDVINQTAFRLEEIRENLCYYVQNPSFYKAEKILTEHNYVLISGIPGIGKSTLADMLVYDSLARGYEQFVLLSKSINEGFKLFEEGKSQVFLFDDFLGANFLKNNLDTNEEKQIIRFIKKVQRSENKRLIFTTREYILNQAKLEFEDFDQNQWQQCVMDLSQYATMVKAQILYNHLFFKGVPFTYIEQLIQQNFLMPIIKHENYNPRIIEYVGDNRLWLQYTPADFPLALLKMFASPFEVWEHAFENQISESAKTVLFGLLLCGGEAELEALFRQVRALDADPTKWHLQFRTAFRQSLKELDNSFTVTSRDRDGKTTIKFHNPSVQDFLVSYCDKDEFIKTEFIHKFIYMKPAISLLAHYLPEYEIKTYFKLSAAQKFILNERLTAEMESLEFSPETFKYVNPSKDDLLCLKMALIDMRFFGWPENPLVELIKVRFTNLIYSEEIGHHGLHAYNNLLINYCSDDPTIDITRILLNLTPCFWNMEDFYILQDFEQYFSEKLNHFRAEYQIEYYEIFQDVVNELCDTGLESKDKLQERIDELHDLSRTYEIDTYDERSQLEKAIEKLEEEEQRKWQREQDDFGQWRYHQGLVYPEYDKDAAGGRKVVFNHSGTEKENIEALFRSMKQND